MLVLVFNCVHIGRAASGAPSASVGGSAHVAAPPCSSLVSAQKPPGDRSLGLDCGRPGDDALQSLPR